ncbi:hypothetical protein KW796_00535 [Candidatus Parcubacteria bacterium]|nr:hypothetical protein [Candidatus Parcubacteria bacterium]
MNRNILVALAVIILAIAAFVWFRNRDESPDTSNPAVLGETTSWKSFSDPARGVAFKYPETLPTKYIQAVDWPPQAAVATSAYNCTEGGAESERAGKTEKRTINGRAYCVTKIIGAAAGSTYTQYAYAVEKGGKTVILTFSIRTPQCANYDEPQKSECQSEVASFSVDNLVDSIVDTLELGTPTLDYDKG